MEQPFHYYDIPLILAGLFAGIRTWWNYNYLLIKENKPKVNFYTYLNKDSNWMANYFIVIPIFSKDDNDESLILRKKINFFFLDFLFFSWIFLIFLAILWNYFMSLKISEI